MKPLNYLKTLAIFLALLVISLPITFAEEFNRVYDTNGNLISDGKYYREYNGLNQLVKVRLGNTSTSPVLEEYLWHPIEERIVVKRVFYNGVYNYTVYYPTKDFVRIVNSSGTFDEKYIYQDGVLVAQIDTDRNKQFIHADHEGSNTLITDLNGNIIENTFYSPYGEIISGGLASRFDYEGKEFDSVVEDYDFHFRKYNPNVPIFNQPDTLIQNVYDPQSLNRYSFERSNPYGNVDEDGHQFQAFFKKYIVPIILVYEFISNLLYLYDRWVEQPKRMKEAFEKSSQRQEENQNQEEASKDITTERVNEGTDPNSVPEDQRAILPKFDNADKAYSEPKTIETPSDTPPLEPEKVEKENDNPEEIAPDNIKDSTETQQPEQKNEETANSRNSRNRDGSGKIIWLIDRYLYCRNC